MSAYRFEQKNFLKIHKVQHTEYKLRVKFNSRDSRVFP